MHFVSADFDLKSYTLEIASFPGKHTGVRIADLVLSLMQQWELDALRLTKIVGDNGSNVIKACKEMDVNHFGCIAHSLHLVVSGALAKTRDEVRASINRAEAHTVAFNDVAEPEADGEQWEEDPTIEIQAIDDVERELESTSLSGSASIEFDAESFDLETDDCLDEGMLDGCLSERAAARIMDVMKQAMAETRKHVASFRKIVTYFNKSAKAKAKLKVLQDVPVPVTVIADVATRWNSTHQMIRRLLQLRPALQRFMAYVQTSSGREEFSDVTIARPTGEMWFHIQCLEKLLVSFDGMTKLISGESYATLPLVLPCLRLLEKRLANKYIFTRVSPAHVGEPYYNATLKRMQLVRRLFLILLRKRFKNPPLDVTSCCLLDPQFANGEFLSTAEREASEQFLVSEAMRLAGANVVDADTNSSFEVYSEDDEDFASELLGLKQWTPEPDAPEGLPLREQVKAELKLYFAKCKLRDKTKKQNKSRDKSMAKTPARLDNALIWWKVNENDFPYLAPVVRKYFGIVATSVPSERCFSTSGNTITARRNRLSGANVRDIIFIHDNSVEEKQDDDQETQDSLQTQRF
ncbi:hypothetical protein PF010_g28712 [Phytophthora fragariae]|uniref:HAT C-terminal dimerisation domain-containing protein n=1 Tax=Phytophthora fragariae TaxID=53985 RepID=A0A6G0JR71_9STRA|nr:hypothetical protein PF010_g28712 [Phytophthora fragariae]